MTIDLTELRRLLENPMLTRGEWVHEGFEVGVGDGEQFVPHVECGSGSDAALIAALRNSAPALLAVVEAADDFIGHQGKHTEEAAYRRLCESFEGFK